MQENRPNDTDMNPSQAAHNRPADFDGLGIAPEFLGIVARLGFTVPTPIQRQAIPIAIQGKDIVGVAQTGTGKTLAFGLPMIQRLLQGEGGGLILLPTRELALQVDEDLRRVGQSLGLRTAVLIGGQSMQPQLTAIGRNPHIVVATPGRLNDHIEQQTVALDAVRILVLDEADRMLDMGFMPQVKRILNLLPRERQTMLFSATLSSDIMRIASMYMQLPIRVEVAPSGTTIEQVTQEIFIVPREAKSQLLEKVLSEYTGSALVFTRTKRGAKNVLRAVREMGHKAAEIHSNRSLGQRRDALEGFKAGTYRVLVATDIAARGIDVKGIAVVINYDLPTPPEDYVHRIGRTGRAGAAGHAISFALPQEEKGVRSIERLIRKNLAISPLPALPPARMATRPSQPFQGHLHRRQGAHSQSVRFGRRQRSNHRPGY